MRWYVEYVHCSAVLAIVCLFLVILFTQTDNRQHTQYAGVGI